MKRHEATGVRRRTERSPCCGGRGARAPASAAPQPRGLAVLCLCGVWELGWGWIIQRLGGWASGGRPAFFLLGSARPRPDIFIREIQPQGAVQFAEVRDGAAKSPEMFVQGLNCSLCYIKYLEVKYEY